MNRRGFLGRVCGATTVVASAGLAAPSPTSDDFQFQGFRILWREYLGHPNQNVLVGMWLAKHQTRDLQWVSTTLGACYPTRDWEVIDSIRQDGWPLLTPFASETERAAVKERARQALLITLDEAIRG